MFTLEKHNAVRSACDFARAHCKFAALLLSHLLVLLSIFDFSAGRAAAADCSSLTGLQLKDTTITSAAVVPATGMLPEYCKVLGSIHNLPQSTILFEVSLPISKWNGKYFVAGGGGYNGVIPRLTQALAEGYAAAGSDTGHEAKDTNWALNNLDAQNNYAYLATHVVTLIGKEILRAFYNQHERRVLFRWVFERRQDGPRRNSALSRRFRCSHLRRSGDRPDQVDDAIRLERSGPGSRTHPSRQDSRHPKGHHERVP